MRNVGSETQQRRRKTRLKPRAIADRKALSANTEIAEPSQPCSPVGKYLEHVKPSIRWNPTGREVREGVPTSMTRNSQTSGKLEEESDIPLASEVNPAKPIREPQPSKSTI